MKKRLLLGAIGVGAVIAVVFFGLSNLGPILKTAVNTYGPQITQTEVRLGGAGVSLVAGEAHLQDFILGNPKGFAAPRAVKVQGIQVKLPVGGQSSQEAEAVKGAVKSLLGN